MSGSGLRWPWLRPDDAAEAAFETATDIRRGTSGHADCDAEIGRLESELAAAERHNADLKAVVRELEGLNAEQSRRIMDTTPKRSPTLPPPAGQPAMSRAQRREAERQAKRSNAGPEPLSPATQGNVNASADVLDRPVDARAQNTRPRFSGSDHRLNRRSRRARARRCKARSTTTRGGRGRSGLFLNNRHYDPTTGVFVSVDPLVTMTGQPYIYGSANPISFSDPSGLCVGGSNCDDYYNAVSGGGSSGSGASSGSGGPGTNDPSGCNPVSYYIAAEMGQNRTNDFVLRERRNQYSCFFCSYSYFRHLSNMKGLSVFLAEGGAWDHKRPIMNMTGTTDPKQFVGLGNGYEARVDVFSNVHYGYVMAYSGVNETTALDYARGDFGFFVNLAVDLGLASAPNVGDLSGADPLNLRIDDAATSLGHGLCGCSRGHGDVPVPTGLQIADAIAADPALLSLGAVRLIGAG